MDLVLARLLLAVAYVLGQLLWLYGVILFIRVIASWLNADPRNWIVSFLHAVTDPVLYEVRRRVPFAMVGGFDLSPIIVFLLIGVLQIVVVGLLTDFAARLLA